MDSAPPESPAADVAGVRALSRATKSRTAVTAQTLESWDPRLSAALAELALRPTAEQHRAVAQEYQRLGVRDRAHAHFTAATRLDPSDAAAFDGLARIWRDWGFASQGFADAYRAVSLAGSSPTVANTLGTLFDAIGKIDDARRWYRRALQLDPTATYALNNLCYATIMANEPDAVAACRRALAVSPRSRIARNHLGLAFAAIGDFARAREEFECSGDLAAAHYNMGILYMAKRQYRDAAQAFEAAMKANPRLARAERRQRQARALAASEKDGRASPHGIQRRTGE